MMIRSNAVLLAAIAVSAVSQSSIFAVLPPLARDIGLSDIEIGSVASIAAFCFVASAPFLGSLSERHGRVPFIVTGLAAAIVTNLIFALTLQAGLGGALSAAAVYGLLLGSRIMLNISWGGMFPAAFAYMADSAPAERRSTGAALIGAAFGIGSIVGPSVAWALTPFGSTAPFIGIASLSLASLIAVMLRLPEPRAAATHGHDAAEPDAPASADGFAQALMRLWPYLLIGLAAAMAAIMIQQLTAFRLQDQFDLTTADAARYAGFALTVLAIATVAAQSLVIWRGESWRPATLLCLGAGAAVIGSAGFALAGLVPAALDNLALVLQCTALVMLGIGIGFVLPSNAAAVMLATGAHSQGRAAGLLNAALGAGTMAGPLLGTALYRVSPSGPFALATLLFSVALIAAVWLRLQPTSDLNLPEACADPSAK
ncbi:MFS transporter [Phreatobacter stygius]|uniref:MFS transporter n=1 Tax=Phreatobacter stygius TaxID=1940610 RepID=A0A4D7BGN4_9HYPH|nr:MFS transporter [Phreatobacter stygius]QCI66957.1 MFS transporter [Phreatobacter stygius]